MRPVADILAELPPRISHLARRWAAETPDAAAMRQGATLWSYAELGAAIDGAAARLRDLGVRGGDRLMLVGENSLALFTLVLAASELDAWAAIINARLSPREIEVIRDHSGARRVLYLVDVSPDAARHAERDGAEPRDFGAIGTVGVGPLGAAAPEPVVADAEQVAALIYTSGTTGAPKGVMLSHRNLMFVGAVSGGLRRVAADDTVYAVLPISHVFGLASVFVGTLYAGGCLFVAPRFDPGQVLTDLDQGVTVFQGVPAMHAKLIEHMRINGIDPAGRWPRLRFVSAGGSPLDPAVKRHVEKRFGLPMHNGYGLTESAPTIAQTRLEDPRGDTACGPLLPGIEARLLDAERNPVPAGAVGELWTRGPGVMKGYYRDAALTATVLTADGWLNTGDMARFDEAGNLFIVGRSKELIIRSGFNVYPVEVEAVLNAHPQVTQSAVVGRPAADGNEEVVAFVQVAPGLTLSPDEILAFAAERLSPYKRPAEVVVMEALPAGPTGKILKNQLARMAQGNSVATGPITN